MRKAQAKPKREIKINEKKDIPISKDYHIPKELEQAFDFVTCLMDIKRNLVAHREIWNNEIKNNDGYLKANYRIALGRMINLCDLMAKPYTEEGVKPVVESQIRVTKWAKSLMEEKAIYDKVKQPNKVMSQVYDSFENEKEFFDSVISAWGFSIILCEKMANFIKREGHGKLFDEFGKKMEKFMKMVDRDIARFEEDTTEYDRKVKKLLTKKKIEFLRKYWLEKGLIA